MTITPALPAVEAFADLDMPAPLLAALGRQGVTVPFPIQAATLPNSLAGRDVLGRGRTGSGKTLAFGLAAAGPHRRAARRAPAAAGAGPGAHPGAGPAGHRRAHPVRPRRCGCGWPPSSAACRSAGRPARCAAAPRSSSRRPGGSRTSSTAATAGWTRSPITVLDEADQMADMGFMPQVTALLDQVRPDGQRMLFSATLDRNVDLLVRRYLHRPGRPLGRPVGGRGHHDGAPRAARPRRRQARRHHRDRRPRRPGDHVPGHQARRRPADPAPARQRRARRRAARRQVPAAAHPHPGPVQDRARHRAGGDQRRRPRHPRRRPRPRRQRRPARPTTRTTCTAAAAPPAPASPAASSPWCCPTSAAT